MPLIVSSNNSYKQAPPAPPYTESGYPDSSLWYQGIKYGTTTQEFYASRSVSHVDEYGNMFYIYNSTLVERLHVEKYSSSGEFLWSKVYYDAAAVISIHAGRSVTVGDSLFLYVQYQPLGTGNSYHGLLKVSRADGTLSWIKRFGTNTYVNTPGTIVACGTEGVYVTGSSFSGTNTRFGVWKILASGAVSFAKAFYSSSVVDPSIGKILYYDSTYSYMFYRSGPNIVLAKILNTDATVVWSRGINTTYNISISGSSFYCNSSSITIASQTYTSAPTYNKTFIQIDHDGNFIRGIQCSQNTGSTIHTLTVVNNIGVSCDANRNQTKVDLTSLTVLENYTASTNIVNSTRDSLGNMLLEIATGFIKAGPLSAMSKTVLGTTYTLTSNAAASWSAYSPAVAAITVTPIAAATATDVTSAITSATVSPTLEPTRTFLTL